VDIDGSFANSQGSFANISKTLLRGHTGEARHKLEFLADINVSVVNMQGTLKGAYWYSAPYGGALLQIYMAPLWICVDLLRIYTALLRIYSAL